MSKWQTVIVRTPEHLGGPGGHTCAVIVAEYDEDTFFNGQDPQHCISEHVVAKIKAAVDDWARESEDARQVIEGINFSFNFGDLAEEACQWTPDDPQSLAHYLQKVGFQNFEIETYHDDDDHAFEYDDLLVDEFSLKEHYQEKNDYDEYDAVKHDLNGPQYR